MSLSGRKSAAFVNGIPVVHQLATTTGEASKYKLLCLKLVNNIPAGGAN